MPRVPLARDLHGFGRREFLDRARRYAVGGVAAGAAFEVMGVPGFGALRAAAAGQVPSEQPTDITPPTITELRVAPMRRTVRAGPVAATWCL